MVEESSCGCFSAGWAKMMERLLMINSPFDHLIHVVNVSNCSDHSLYLYRNFKRKRRLTLLSMDKFHLLHRSTYASSVPYGHRLKYRTSLYKRAQSHKHAEITFFKRKKKSGSSAKGADLNLSVGVVGCQRQNKPVPPTPFKVQCCARLCCTDCSVMNE